MKLLLYCTKSKKQLFFDKIKQIFMFGLNRKNDKFNSLNGKIVAECDYEVEEIFNSKLFNNYATWGLGYKELLNKSNLTEKEIVRYLGTQNIPHKVYKQYSCNCGYAIHIKNLHIFDEPKKLNDYHISYYNKELGMMREKHLEKAPQNMCRAFDINDNYIVISIRPEWLCKILNGEKTVEVRRKVLKEMLKCL